MRVLNVDRVGTADVFNMTVDGTHDFVLDNGIVTHNCDEMRYFCMGRPIPPRLIEAENKPLSDPLEQFKTAGKYSKYNAITKGR